MDHIANQATSRSLGLGPNNPNSNVRSAVRGASPRLRTTGIGPFLLAATVVLLPLQDHIPNVAGFSIMYIIFGVMGGYILWSRSGALARVSMHPVFLATYALLCLGFLIESVHSNSDYSELMRCGYMIAGAVFVATLCKDKGALRVGMYGYLIASVWLSIFLFLTSYGALRGATAADFNTASQIRIQVMSQSYRYLEASMNTMAFISSQGVVVALALALTSKSQIRRFLFLGIALFCLIASFLPMSRAGTLIAIVSALIIIFKYKAKRVRAVVAALVLGIGILIWVPDIVFSRLQYSTETREGKMEARAMLYATALETLPEYVMTGVGTGNFFGSWGRGNAFNYGGGGVTGAHNSFIQVTIYWGLAGLLALIAVVWQAYRCLPKRRSDALALSLQGIAVSLLFWMLVNHCLYAKEFSLGLGLLVGARHWNWRRRKPFSHRRYGSREMDRSESVSR